MKVQSADPDEARQAVTDAYLPHRLELGRDRSPLAMELTTLRIGTMAVGRLGYGRNLTTVSADLDNFHVNVPVRGTALTRRGRGEPVALTPGSSAVLDPGAPAEIVWSADCAQLCLMVSRASLESALEQLLDTPVRDPLSFELYLDARDDAGAGWRGALRVLHDQLVDPDDSVRNPLADRHVEAVVLDRLLLGQRHNYSEALRRSSPSASGRAVRMAVELMEERPREPWTSLGLAAAVHVSVRTLQQQFQDDLGTTPMAYLRNVRLRRVREELVAASPELTTVRTIATGVGFLHQGRFAALYRETYGETPSDTLRRALG